MLRLGRRRAVPVPGVAEHDGGSDRGANAHAWGCIPGSATDAANRVHGKPAEGDVDELFLNALGIRWLLFDEVSTLSLSLLGILDAYLRRACKRHPFAHRQRAPRPFGGINLLFAGDLWQLPPVQASEIFPRFLIFDSYYQY